jgi:hypothetical protein
VVATLLIPRHSARTDGGGNAPSCTMLRGSLKVLSRLGALRALPTRRGRHCSDGDRVPDVRAPARVARKPNVGQVIRSDRANRSRASARNPSTIPTMSFRTARRETA